MDPVIFDLGWFQLRWYSVFILLAVFVAYFVLMNEAKKQHVKTDFIFNMLFWTIIFGIIGARLYFVMFNFGSYKDDITEVWKIWNGGLAIHGGIIAGFLTIVFYCRKYKVRLIRALDISTPALIIAQAIGRWGNFFNQEAYGSIVEYSELVDMKIIPGFIIDNMYIKGAYRLPMFYFESILCVIGFIILLVYRRRKYAKNGQVTALYLMWYGLIRFFIEAFRSDSLMFFDIKVAQVVSVIMFGIGLFIFVKQARKPVLEDLYTDSKEDIRF